MEIKKVVSLFSGCGGLDYGFNNSNYEIVWANELDQDAAESYRRFIGHDIIVDDIWNVMDCVPKADIVIGGPPCQSFSLVGKRIEDDPRGKLVFAFFKIVKRLLPSVFIMENVAGMASSKANGIRLTDYIAEKYQGIGYKVKILKLNAADYFVPQKRKRIIIIGYRKEEEKFKMIKEKEFSKILGDERLANPVSTYEALEDLPPPLPKGSLLKSAYNKDCHSPFSRLMRRNNQLEVSLQTMPTMSLKDSEFIQHIPPGGNYMDIPDSISTKRIMNFKKTGGRTTTYGRLHPERPAYTINTYFNRPNVGANYHYKEDRLITVREALRLQSFPDDFTPFFSNQRSLHKQVGNAVPPLLSKAISLSLNEIV